MRNIEEILKKTDKEVAQFLKNSYEFCSLKRKAFEEKALLVSGDNLKSMEEQRGMILDSCKDELECLSGAYDAQVYELDVYRRDGFIDGDDEIEIICMVIDEVKSSQFSSIILDECKSLRGMSKSVWVIMSNNKERYSNLFPEFYALIQKEFQPSPSEIKLNGVEISICGLCEGYYDYYSVAEMAQAEFIDIYSEEYADANWELYNGDDYYYYDSDGHTYDYESCVERINELQDLVDKAEEGQDTTKWKEDIDSLMYKCEPIGICDYMKITEEAARFMKESGSNEIVYYLKELDAYIWGITHCGTSWRSVLTSIPILEDETEEVGLEQV